MTGRADAVMRVLPSVLALGGLIVVLASAAALGGLLWGGGGPASFATAQGDRRFEHALSDLLDHPQRGIRNRLGGLPAMLLGVVGSDDLRLKEVGDAVVRLRLEVGEACDVRLGTVFDAAEGANLSLVALLFHSWTRPEGGEAEVESTGPVATPRLAAADAPRPVSRRKLRPSTPPHVEDRFKNTHSTAFEGEDLDQPTYYRRGLRFDAS